MLLHKTVSSIHRQKDRPYWYCSFLGPDGKWHFKSTGTRNKAEAAAVCQQMAKGAQLSRRGRLTPERAREIIEATVSDIMDLSGQALPRSSIREFFKSWISEKGPGLALTSKLRYESILNRFLAFIGDARSSEGLSTLCKADVLEFKNHLASEVSESTVNCCLKVLRVSLNGAVKDQLIRQNPAKLVDKFSRPKNQHERRGFTPDELRTLIKEADDQWRRMIYFSLYTGGQRLSDVANLTWNNIDLQQRQIAFVTRKTGRQIILPIAKPLFEFIHQSMTAGDDPNAPICPDLYGKNESRLSNAFFQLMAQVGMVKSRADHSAKKQGRGRKRTLSPISFHSLRHTATSLLKNAGVSDAIARDIVGHDSVAVSRHYTHVDQPTKRKALDGMPDIGPDLFTK